MNGASQSIVERSRFTLPTRVTDYVRAPCSESLPPLPERLPMEPILSPCGHARLPSEQACHGGEHPMYTQLGLGGRQQSHSLRQRCEGHPHATYTMDRSSQREPQRRWLRTGTSWSARWPGGRAGTRSRVFGGGTGQSKRVSRAELPSPVQWSQQSWTWYISAVAQRQARQKARCEAVRHRIHCAKTHT